MQWLSKDVEYKRTVVFYISSSDMISSFVYSDVNGEIVCRLSVTNLVIFA